MKNVILPKKYSEKKLEEAKLELFAKAKSNFSNIELCGFTKSWNECYTGFCKEDKLIMIFSFNIGVNTHAVYGEFEIFD